MANIVSMKALLEAGVHFGHQTRRWDPRMRQYIFTERNGIHIIDLQQTVQKLGDAYGWVRELASGGGTLLFVGTKKQAQEAIETEASRASAPWINQRWLGGMLTNFRTIQTRVRRLEELEAMRDNGALDRLPKKEAARLTDELDKLNRVLGGIRNMHRLPDAIFIIDPHKERLAITEAKRLEIPIVSLVDTNCNPDEIDHPIPANDDAIRAVKLLSGKIADALLEGQRQREAEMEAAAAEKATAELEAGEMTDEDEEKAAAYTEGETVFSASPDDDGAVRAAAPAPRPTAAPVQPAESVAEQAAAAEHQVAETPVPSATE